MLDEALLQQLPSALDPTTRAASQVVSEQLSTSEWLGPLAPVALSPFFGLAVLSGIGTYGPEALQQRSAIFQSGGSLDSPLLFWSMAGLAVFTSLPRLTKVSKPISLAAEKLEAYSAIVILICVRMFGSQFQAGAPEIQGGPQMGLEGYSSNELMLSAGVGTFSLNVMMSAFAALNIFVVNVVKLFFEFLVWLIPVPAIDAVVELCNKSLCGALMALYCYSPWLATLVNLAILACSLIVFLWVYRRMNYYKDLIAGPALAWLLPSWFGQRGQTFQAFVESSTQRLPKYLPVTLTSEGSSYRAVGRRGFSRLEWILKPIDQQTVSENGWICQRLKLIDSEGKSFVLSYRKWVAGDALYKTPGTVAATTAS